MSTGHIIPGSEPDAGSEAERSVTGPPPPEPTHAERVRTLLAGAGRGSLSTVALDPPGYPFGSVVSFGLDEAGPAVVLREHDGRAHPEPAGRPPGEPAGHRGRARGIRSPGRRPGDPARRRLRGRRRRRAGRGPGRVPGGQPRGLLCRLRRLPVPAPGGAAVRYVGGFGRMSWVGVDEYAAADPDPLAPAAAGIVAHMNADHADALVELAHHAGRGDVDLGGHDGRRPLRLRRGRRGDGGASPGRPAHRVPDPAGHGRRGAPRAGGHAPCARASDTT